MCCAAICTLVHTTPTATHPQHSNCALQEMWWVHQPVLFVGHGGMGMCTVQHHQRFSHDQTSAVGGDFTIWLGLMFVFVYVLIELYVLSYARCICVHMEESWYTRSTQEMSCAPSTNTHLQTHLHYTHINKQKSINKPTYTRSITHTHTFHHIYICPTKHTDIQGHQHTSIVPSSHHPQWSCWCSMQWSRMKMMSMGCTQ